MAFFLLKTSLRVRLSMFKFSSMSCRVFFLSEIKTGSEVKACFLVTNDTNLKINNYLCIAYKPYFNRFQQYNKQGFQQYTNNYHHGI